MSNATAAEAPLSASSHEVESCDLPVQGMSCASCVGRVERALRAVPGVSEAVVNLATGNATVHYSASHTGPRALAQAIEAAGYRVPAVSLSSEPGKQRAEALLQAEQEEQRTLRRDFLIAVIFTLPLLVIAMAHGAIPGLDGALGRWLQLGLATPVVFGPGRRFLKLAWLALRHRSSDMNTLVSIGALAAWLYSSVALMAPNLFTHGHGAAPHLYFEAAAAILTFVLLGKLLETRARRRLSDAVRGLMKLLPETARRVRGTEYEAVALAELTVGDLILVKPGERIPVDGLITHGASAVDESLLTGESIPVDKTAGDNLHAGTLNQNGALTARVTSRSDDTSLAHIVQAVEQAQGSRAPIARLADVVSSYFVPVVLGIALLTGVIWLLLDPSAAGFSTALERMVAVLVIACPCALGLATPAAVAVGTGRGAELGILVKGGAALEATSRIDTVLLDKTGTLTEGKPTLTDVISTGVHTEIEILGLVASVEQHSEHPIAQALVQGARERGAMLQAADSFHMDVGFGVQAVVAGHVVRVGTSHWLKRAQVDAQALEARAQQLALLGRTPAFVAVDEQLVGLLAVADRPTDQAKQAVAALLAMGIDVAMVTGDRQGTAQAVAKELGITRVIAEVKPRDKARIVEEEKARGRNVAMVGDGINDAPALAAAHVGIALGSGADIAVAAADVALLRHGIAQLPHALRLARTALATIRQNLFWAFVYNLIGIPVAAGLLYPFTGWLLSPILASAAMSLSSVSVLLNSLRLRRFEA